MPERSQYALFVLVVTFTWLMGLMGFARSGIRQHWHVWEVMRDTSEWAATPALGYAAPGHQRVRADLPRHDLLHLLARRLWSRSRLVPKPAPKPGLEPAVPSAGGPSLSPAPAD
jgi:hypothetical protein